MTAFSSTWDTPDSDASSFLTRRAVRLRFLDGRSMEGHLHVPEGQSLVGFLGMRRSFLNVTDARWLDGGDGALPHVGIRLGHVVWVVPVDPAFALHQASVPPDSTRSVELGLEGGLVLRVRLQIADEQRMSDFFDGNPDFVPLRAVEVGTDPDRIERMAVRRDAIRTIREV